MTKKLLIALFVLTSYVHTDIFGQQIPNYVPQDSLQAWYPFDQNGNNVKTDKMHISINGATRTSNRYSQDTSAYNFDGTNTANNGSVSEYITGNNGFSISIWVNLTSMTGELFDMRANNGSSREIYIQDSIIYVTNFNNPYSPGSHSLPSKTKLKPNNWYHIVYTQEYSNNTNKLYINGNLDTFHIASAVDLPNPKITFGARNDIWGNTNNFLNGKLDEIGVWNRNLNYQDVKSLYTISTGIIQNQNLISNFIYPNPSTHSIFINISNEDTKIKIFNLMGEQIINSDISKANNFEIINNGIYFIQLLDKEDNIIGFQKILIE